MMATRETVMFKLSIKRLKMQAFSTNLSVFWGLRLIQDAWIPVITLKSKDPALSSGFGQVWRLHAGKW
jgi:hypothetical protein